MKKLYAKVGTKIYIPTPWGEIQIGTKYKSLVIWHKRKCHIIKSPKGFPNNR
jgi:hypothetical protein